jgi:hypothetical protein
MAKSDKRKDGYPSVADALAAVAAEVSEEDAPVVRLTIQTLASGEITYTIHRRGDEEGTGGYIPPADATSSRADSKR